MHGTPSKSFYKQDNQAKVVARNQHTRQQFTEIAKRRFAWYFENRSVILPLLDSKKNFFVSHEKSVKPPYETIPYELVEQPEGIKNGTMKDYQLEGLSFMLYLHRNGINGILGDEMGLGKTLQTISLLTYLKDHNELNAPALVIAPLSVLGSWMTEIARWSPSLSSVRFHGGLEERKRLKHELTNKSINFDVIVTTYEQFVAEEYFFKHRYAYSYVIVDEGHKLKNETSQISMALQHLSAQHRLLLTGTPLQNNLAELWALLHWLHPEVFDARTKERFTRAFDLSKGVMDREFMDHCRGLLSRIMMRRTKGDVELSIPEKEETTIFLPLSPMQRWWYKRLLTRLDTHLLAEIFEGEQDKTMDGMSTSLSAAQDQSGEMKEVWDYVLKEAKESHAEGKKSDWQKLMGLVFQLRKVANHPYLFPGSEPEPFTNGEHMAHASSKMALLDKLLPKLKKEGRRVLLFSNSTAMLDILGDYLDYRQFKHARLDGGTSRVKRNLDIRLFNSEHSDTFIFLLSTRAGGLGINLTSADTVIFYDTDWNPQMDLQALARAHRIGQKKVVKVYRLITKGTVEERVYERSRQKLFLDAKVIGQLKTTTDGDQETSTAADASEQDDLGKMSAKELKSIIKFGANSILKMGNDYDEFLTKDIEAIIDQSGAHEREEVSQDTESFEPIPLSSLPKLRDFEGEVHKNMDIGQEWRELQKRARNERVVIVDGVPVLKETLGLPDWEAVPTYVSTNQIEKAEKRKRKQFENQGTCHNCWDGGNLVLCIRCPRSYCYGCLGVKSEKDLKQRHFTYFTCTQHNCFTCNRSTTDAGGILFRCRCCPASYCDDCMPEWDKCQLIGYSIPEMAELRYGQNNQCYWIKCPDCVKAGHTVEGYEDVPVAKKMKTEDGQGNEVPATIEKSESAVSSGGLVG